MGIHKWCRPSTITPDIGHDHPAATSLTPCIRWVRCHPGIYCLAGIATSFDMNAWIAVLAAGPEARLSHRTAGKLQKLEGTPPPVRFDVSVPDVRVP
jgi:hypothetical protein